jgi:hypothetical protein
MHVGNSTSLLKYSSQNDYRNRIKRCHLRLKSYQIHVLAVADKYILYNVYKILFFFFFLIKLFTFFNDLSKHINQFLYYLQLKDLTTSILLAIKN